MASSERKGLATESMSKLDALLAHFKAHQRECILQEAEFDMPPAEGVLRRIADTRVGRNGDTACDVPG